MKILAKMISIIFILSIWVGNAVADGREYMEEFYAAPDGVKVIYG